MNWFLNEKRIRSSSTSLRTIGHRAQLQTEKSSAKFSEYGIPVISLNKGWIHFHARSIWLQNTIISMYRVTQVISGMGICIERQSLEPKLPQSCSSGYWSEWKSTVYSYIPENSSGHSLLTNEMLAQVKLGNISDAKHSYYMKLLQGWYIVMSEVTGSLIIKRLKGQAKLMLEQCTINNTIKNCKLKK